MWGAILFCAVLCEASICVAQDLTPQSGIWVPVEGELGRRAMTHLSVGGDDLLYAIGSGRVWRRTSPTNLQEGSAESTKTWLQVGRYAPSLTWDESIGVDASGPFSPALLSEVERQVSENLEAALEGQGDEDWISEDAAMSMIETFEEEVSPSIDSPYRVNGVFPQQAGIWLATGAGVWATSRLSKEGEEDSSSMVPLPASPAPTLSVTQVETELWVSTPDQILTSIDYLTYVSESNRLEGDKVTLAWQTKDLSPLSQLFNFFGQVYIFDGQKLFSLNPNGVDKSETILPVGTHTIAVESNAIDRSKGNRLWAMTDEGIWRSGEGLGPKASSLAWQRCTSVPQPMTHLKISEEGIIAIAPEAMLLISHDCMNVKTYLPPLSESVTFTDVMWWKGRLYCATSGGLFVWEDERALSISEVSLRYLKRDLALFPEFFQLYQAALREQQLDPRVSSYGARPVLSALLPQLALRYNTNPSRVDLRPTFSAGSRQLTLLQPKPEYSIFLEWRVSLDFLTALIDDPERGSAYYEAQSQLEVLATDPLSTEIDLESEAGLFEDWSDDTFTSQAQRLAMTTLALERRQKHRDRAHLRTKLARLHRERIKITYKRWLDGASEDQLAEYQLRLQELDAHLDAMTGYRLQIQDKMKVTL